MSLLRPPFDKHLAVGSIVVDNNPKAGETPTRRNARTADALITQPTDGVNTVADILRFAERKHAKKNALGWRDIINVHEEVKEVKKIVGGREVTENKTWKYFELSSYKYMSFTELKGAVDDISRGLTSLGIEKGQVFNVYAQTSPNWQLISYACATISAVIATAYDTLGESGLTHSLSEPECVGVFTNAELLSTLTRVLPNTPTIRFVIYDGEASEDQLNKLKKARDELQVYTLDEVRNMGKGKPLDESRLPSGDDVACIMYTSGTTGPPKGVVLSHGNLVSSIGAIWHLLGHHFRTDDTYMAFLPLAHILEYIVELALLYLGLTLGYGRVKTLTDASVRNCYGDLHEFKPSVMVGVPAIWEMIRKGVVGRVHDAGYIKQLIFNVAYNIKSMKLPILSTIADLLVFNQIKAQTGGRLRLALCGGASLSPDTQEFINVTLLTLVQGYGMTETCGMCTILPPEYMQASSVGLPMPSTEIKLLDVPEAGYLSTNNPAQGEVLIRGPSVTKGYYKRDDLNNDRSIFTEDGWLRTGDVGQWNKDGTISLIDRVKNLIKLQGGEYIALERLETIYKSCDLVANLCVHASTNAKQPIAIVIPAEAALRRALAQNNSSSKDASLAELCHSDEAKNIILKACNALGKKNGFKSLEMLEAVVLTPDEWTPESGLVTAAQKIQRKKIAEAFNKEIKEAYKSAS